MDSNAKFIYSKFIRYELLDQILPTSMINAIRVSNLIDIYIDVQSLFKYVLSTELIQPKVMSVSLLNAAAHYRHYFRKKFNKPVRVFIVDAQNDATGSLFTIVNNKNLTYSYDFIETMCKYFPDIFYIRKINFNASTIILTTIKKYGGNPSSTTSIVMSNDIYSYQFPVLNMNTFTIKISRTKVKMVTQFNAIYEWNPRNTPTAELSQSLLPLIMALNKCEELNMPCLANFKAVIARLKTLIANSAILNGYNTPNDMLVQKGLISEDEYNRWRLADLNVQTGLYSYSMQCLDDSWRIKKSCDFQVLASTIDQTINSNPDTILNYAYLLE